MILVIGDISVPVSGATWNEVRTTRSMSLYRASIGKGIGVTRNLERRLQRERRSTMCFPDLGHGATRIP
jgi:hypothetical protein